MQIAKERLNTCNKFNYKFVITVLLCGLTLFLCTIAVIFRKGDIFQTDINFHTGRILGIVEAIKAGQFPIKYYSNFYNGAGYFSPVFYGDLFLALPAILVLCGIPLKVAYYIFIAVMMATIWLSFYCLAKKYISNKNFCAVGATLFLISQYIFADIFWRGAIGESLAIIFIIWLISGIHNMLKEGYSKPWIFTLSFLGLLFSHMTSLILATIGLIVVVLINCKKLFVKKSFWLKSLFAVGAFLIIGFYSLVSFLEMYFADTYMITRPWTNLSDNSMSFIKILGFDLYGLGAICILPFVLRIFVRKNENNIGEVKTINMFLIISIAFIILTSQIFPWKLFDKLLGFIQFPSRLNIIPSLLLAIVSALELKCIWQQNKTIVKFTLVCMLLFAVPFNNFVMMHMFGFDYANVNVNKVYEWVPISAAGKLEMFDILSVDSNLYDNNNNIVTYTRKAHDTALTFSSEENANYYLTPIIYYKGYKAVITFEDGSTKSLKVEQTENGLVKVITNHMQGKVQVYYKSTVVQNIGLSITLVGSCVVAVVGATKLYIKRKRKVKVVQNQTKIER